MNISKLLRRVLNRVFVAGGDTFLYDVEGVILRNVKTALPEEDAMNFTYQVERLDLVQRSPDGKIVALYESADPYFRDWGGILIRDRRANNKLFDMVLSGEDCPVDMLKAQVYFHLGRISSIEYDNGVSWPATQKRLRMGPNILNNASTETLVSVVVLRAHL